MYISISIYMLHQFQYTYIYGNGKLPLFSANRKWKLVFLGRQTINGNQHLLFQQTCPSMLVIVFPFGSMC